jgi:uncharacterized membrane protein YgdD (TMEM256/DUF423 family)
MTRYSYALSAFASLMGAAGVALAAAAVHIGGGSLAETGALFLILHAAALLGLCALAAQASGYGLRHALLICGFGLGLAACIFAADLASRAIAGGRLFPFAAPAGGTSMILFWVVIAATFAVGAVRRK